MAFTSREDFEKLAGEALKKYGQVADKKLQKVKWKQHQERLRFSSKGEGRMQEHSEEQLSIERFSEFQYQARTWKQFRRVVYRVRFTITGPDVRYVVTNARGQKPRNIYQVIASTTI